jgi:myosin-5
LTQFADSAWAALRHIRQAVDFVVCIIFPSEEENLCDSWTQFELSEICLLSNILPIPFIHQVISLKPIRTWDEIRNDICPVSVHFAKNLGSFWLDTVFRTDLAICSGSQFAAAREDSWYVLGRCKWNECNFS